MLAVFFAMKLAKLAAERKEAEAQALREAEAARAAAEGSELNFSSESQASETLEEKRAACEQLERDIRVGRAGEAELRRVVASQAAKLSQTRGLLMRAREAAGRLAAQQEVRAAEAALREAQGRVSTLTEKVASRERRLELLKREVDALQAEDHLLRLEAAAKALKEEPLELAPTGAIRIYDGQQLGAEGGSASSELVPPLLPT